eukprot:gene11032-9057_t
MAGGTTTRYAARRDIDDAGFFDDRAEAPTPGARGEWRGQLAPPHNSRRETPRERAAKQRATAPSLAAAAKVQPGEPPDPPALLKRAGIGQGRRRHRRGRRRRPDPKVAEEGVPEVGSGAGDGGIAGLIAEFRASVEEQDGGGGGG